MPDAAGYIVVGVLAGQPPNVVHTAATVAEHFGAELVCATVDLSHYTVAETGAVMPLDPDQYDDAEPAFDAQLRKQLKNQLRDRPVRWSTRILAGGAAQELDRLAEHLDASMIVVGTRRAGLKGSVEQFFNGSVAVQLAHRQHRPVLVVPRP